MSRFALKIQKKSGKIKNPSGRKNNSYSSTTTTTANPWGKTNPCLAVWCQTRVPGFVLSLAPRLIALDAGLKS